MNQIDQAKIVVLMQANLEGQRQERDRVLALIDDQRGAYTKNSKERQILDFVRKLVENNEQPRQKGLGV